MKTILIILAIALAVVGTGCNGSSVDQPSAKASNSPASPKKLPPQLSQTEIGRVAKLAEALRGRDALATKQEIDSLGIQAVACEREKLYLTAKELQAALEGPLGQQLADTKEVGMNLGTVKALKSSLLHSYGETAIMAAKAGKVDCYDSDAEVPSGSVTASDMLFSVVSEANLLRVDMQKEWQVSPAEIRQLALAKTREEMAASGLKKHLNLPEEERSGDIIGGFDNPWKFSAKELGLTAAEAETLQVE